MSLVVRYIKQCIGRKTELGPGAWEAAVASTRARGGVDSYCGKKTLEMWGLLMTLNSCQHGSQYGIGISDDYVAMIFDPVARAHVEVAVDTLDCLAREFRYY